MRMALDRLSLPEGAAINPVRSRWLNRSDLTGMGICRDSGFCGWLVELRGQKKGLSSSQEHLGVRNVGRMADRTGVP